MQVLSAYGCARLCATGHTTHIKADAGDRFTRHMQLQNWLTNQIHLANLGSCFWRKDIFGLSQQSSGMWNEDLAMTNSSPGSFLVSQKEQSDKTRQQRGHQRLTKKNPNRSFSGHMPFLCIVDFNQTPSKENPKKIKSKKGTPRPRETSTEEHQTACFCRRYLENLSRAKKWLSFGFPPNPRKTTGLLDGIQGDGRSLRALELQQDLRKNTAPSPDPSGPFLYEWWDKPPIAFDRCVEKPLPRVPPKNGRLYDR